MRCLFRSGRKEEIAEISIYSQMRCYHFINPLNALIPKKTSWKKKKKKKKEERFCGNMATVEYLIKFSDPAAFMNFTLLLL